MTRKHKFRQGEVITSLDALVGVLEAGHWVYYRHKPLHPGWVIGMSLHTLIIALRSQSLRYALENEGGKKDEQI